MSHPLPPHGTVARRRGNTTRPPCLCLECVQGMRRTSKLQAFRRAQGISGEVPSDLAAAHIRNLLSKGRNLYGIAADSGVGITTVRSVVNRGGPILRTTEKKILAVSETPDPMTVVDSTGTVRRLRALVAMGHSQKAISDGMPCAYTFVTMLTNGRKKFVKMETALRAQRLYGELSMRQGASESGRKMAARRAWAPPLAWDDETIDDPAARPVVSVGAEEQDAVDLVAVRRYVAGSRVVLSDAEFLVAMQEFQDRGLSRGQVDALHGLDKFTTERRVYRLKRQYERAGRDWPLSAVDDLALISSPEFGIDEMESAA